MISGSPGSDIAERWATLKGPMVEPGVGWDGVLERIKATRDAVT